MPMIRSSAFVKRIAPGEIDPAWLQMATPANVQSFGMK